MYPRAYWPGDSEFAQLEFALKYEGLNLSLLRILLPRLDIYDLTGWIKSKPTGAYARRIWFLFEQFSGERLDLADLSQGNYVELADPKIYYTGPRRPYRRQRIHFNLLGDLRFCVFIRRTDALAAWVAKQLDQQVRQVVAEIPPEIFRRALDYLYKKETRSSYAIERETPDQERAARFVEMLQRAEKGDFLNKPALVQLQQAIVDPRYQHTGWRDAINEQNFVSEPTPLYEDLVHFIAPRPQEIADLMEAWLAASRLMMEADCPPVVAAAAVAWTFVFLHPFSDGNGRIHRFLIHHILARRGFAPEGVIFPVSAAMLDDPRAYDASLEAFSKPLLPLIKWSFDEDREMNVEHDTSDLYRSIDCTAMAEALFNFVERTIERDLPAELQFLLRYDEARRRMRAVVELPDPVAARFIRFCQQNGWKLSAAKRRKGGLEKLTDDEIAALESAVREVFAEGTV
ncbi:MAG: Fic family protein [Chthoniobacterales bacterium]